MDLSPIVIETPAFESGASRPVKFKIHRDYGSDTVILTQSIFMPVGNVHEWVEEEFILTRDEAYNLLSSIQLVTYDECRCEMNSPEGCEMSPVFNSKKE